MKLLGLTMPWETKAESISLDTLIHRLEAVFETVSGIAVTPETCMESPTVHAVVTGASRIMATLPIHVLRKTDSGRRVSKEALPNHPVTRLLASPNENADRVNFWLDATSWFIRYGYYVAFKGRGATGPIRRLQPLHPGEVEPKLDDDGVRLMFKLAGGRQIYERSQVLYMRGPARDGIKGDSPIMDIRETIALEIAATQHGASFFGNGAAPFIVFQYLQGIKGFKTDEEKTRFIADFQAAFGGRRKHRAMVVPPGMEVGAPIPIDNDKAQFLETRKLVRNVICGGLGFPPDFVGDLEHQTFNNAEQQSRSLITRAMLPIVRIFEAAMERDLLTQADRNSGVIIRFNLDGALRGDFKTRQEGQKIQREMGIINANDWRENEDMNPIDEADGGEDYWTQGPSGQNPQQQPVAVGGADDDESET